MSTMALETILCDFGEDCEAEPPWVSSHAEYTRIEAAKNGWTTGWDFTYDAKVMTLDFCPEHSGTASPAEEPWPPPVKIDWAAFRPANARP